MLSSTYWLQNLMNFFQDKIGIFPFYFFFLILFFIIIFFYFSRWKVSFYYGRIKILLGYFQVSNLLWFETKVHWLTALSYVQIAYKFSFQKNWKSFLTAGNALDELLFCSWQYGICTPVNDSCNLPHNHCLVFILLMKSRVIIKVSFHCR